MRLLLIALIPMISVYLPVYGQAEDPEEPLLLKTIYFGGGSYYISDDQVVGIKNFFEGIENIENFEITISGHTDNIGGKEYNEWLSLMRSMSVKREILQLEIPEELVHIREFGQDNPLYDNRRWEGKLRNRRVDIILTPIVF